MCRFVLLALLIASGLPCIVRGDDEAPYGIAQRVLWITSRVVGSPEPPSPYRTAKMFEKLELKQPVYLAAEPGTNRLIMVELMKSGNGPVRLRRFVNDPQTSELETLLELDWLVYGFAFHPKFSENGYIYLVSNGPVKEKDKRNRISRFTIDRKPPHGIDPASELVIIEFESNGHNGGEAAFGPDGMLYCATGDGTSDSDPLHTGQGVNDLLAVMLRLDVDHPSEGRAYSIPPDNPFINMPDARPEIWAFGFRNPWRMTFDKQTGRLWCTQNGQDLWEQVYVVRRGENYGWSVQEGSHPFYLDRPRGPGPIVPPTVEHHHSEARSLTGGVVYYGAKLPELQGAYIYGDYSTGRVWGVRHDGEKVTWHQELVDTPFAIVGFAETQDGELIVIDQYTGFYRLEPRPPEAESLPFPQKLSETGVFAETAKHAVAAGLIPYSVNTPLWSDGAHKDRYIGLPGDTQIEFNNTKAWDPPEGTVLVKTFSLDLEAGNPASRKRIETRLLTKQQKEWVGYSYLWNDAQTDGELVGKPGLDRELTIRDSQAPGGTRRQTWHFPSRAECLVCHSRAAGFVLGLQTEQMNRVHDYDGVKDNQLRTLSHLGVFQKALPKAASEYGAFPDPYDDTAPLDQRVRAYLHVNCSNCHQHAGGGNAQIELPYATALDKTNLINVPPYHDKFDLKTPKIVSPGDPANSVLLTRMTRRGRGQMPPLATSLIDEPGAKLVEAWIRSLPREKDAPGSD